MAYHISTCSDSELVDVQGQIQDFPKGGGGANGRQGGGGGGGAVQEGARKL